MITAYQNEQEWLEARSAEGRIPSSDVATVLGINQFKTRLQLYAERRGESEPMKKTQAVERGHRLGHILEPLLSEMYEEETGRSVKDPGDYTIYTTDDYPCFSCTPDRISHDRVVQLKTVGAYMGDRWKEDVPLYVQSQVQVEMCCVGHDLGDVAAYLFAGHEFLIVEQERNQGFLDRSHQLCLNFLECVKLGIPPDPVERDSALVNYLIGRTPVEESEIKLPESAIELDEIIVRAKEQKKFAERDTKSAQNRMKMLIGKHSVGVLPDGQRYTLKTVSKKAHEVKASEYRELRRVK